MIVYFKLFQTISNYFKLIQTNIMKTKQILWIATSTIIFIASCAKVPVSKVSNEQAINVQAETISETTVSTSIQFSGVLSSKRISKLSFKTGGIINQILVKEGISVKKGQLLASLDMTEISAQVQQAKVAFEKADRDLKRVKNLFADSVVTQEQLENATSAYQAALETKNIAEFNLRYSQIVAPANGKIISKLAEENELTGPGMPVLIFSEQGNDEWIVKTGVSDRDIVALKNGDKAIVTFDAFEGREFVAHVTQLAQLADQSSGTFEVELSLRPGDVQFINGLVANIKINSSDKRTVSLVPPDAITEADGNKGFVYVVNEKDSTAIKTPVTISHIQNNEIAVLEPLNKMGKVVTKGAAYLEDGSKINQKEWKIIAKK